jgi:hypothetical protein
MQSLSDVVAAAVHIASDRQQSSSFKAVQQKVATTAVHGPLGRKFSLSLIGKGAAFAWSRTSSAC